MSSLARTIVLTEAGMRITDLIRSGVIPAGGNGYGKGRRPTTPRCAHCRLYVAVTPREHARSHKYRGAQCPGTGERVTL